MAVSLISPSVTECGGRLSPEWFPGFSGAPDLCIKCLIRCPKVCCVLVFVVGSLLPNFSLLKLWNVNPRALVEPQGCCRLRPLVWISSSSANQLGMGVDPVLLARNVERLSRM